LEYKDESDVLTKFTNECIIKTENKKDMLNITTIYNYYKEWHTNNSNIKPLSTKDLVKHLDSLYGKREKGGPKNARCLGWTMIKVCDENTEERH
jgi:phage/plasmid-associated DNA primase